MVFYAKDGLTSADMDDSLYVTEIIRKTSDYTDVYAFVAGSDELQQIKIDGDDVSSGRAYTYDVNSDGYYELDSLTVGDDGVDGKSDVGSDSSSTFVLANGNEYEITSDTLFVDDSDYLDDPTAELGAGPSEGDYVTWVTYNSNDEAILVVIANDEVDSGSSSSDEDDTDVDGTDTDFDDPTLVRNTITIAYTGEEPGRAAIEDQVIAAVKGEYTDATEVAVSNLDVDAATVTVSITRANDTTSTTEYDLAFYNKTANTSVTGDLGETESSGAYEFVSEVTVVGNTVKMDAEIPEDKEVRDVYMNDVARFLGSLYRNGKATEIKYDDVTYTWDAEGELKGSNWKDSEGTTLVYAIFGSVNDDTAKNPTTITLTVDGVDMVINLVG